MMRIQIVIDDQTKRRAALFSDSELLLRSNEKEPKKVCGACNCRLPSDPFTGEIYNVLPGSIEMEKINP